MTDRHKVILRGLNPSVEESLALQNLAALFKSEPAKVKLIFERPEFVVRKDLPLDLAKKYQKAIENAGAICRIESESMLPDNLAWDLDHLASADPDATISAERESAIPNLSKCSKCDAVLEIDSRFCTSCGEAVSAISAPRGKQDAPATFSPTLGTDSSTLKQGIPNAISGERQSWYYELNGERIGPVIIGEIEGLVSSGTISRDTYIWSNGQSDWLPIGQTDLKRLFASNPPPLTASAVSNTVVWWLAFAPALGQFGSGFLSAATYTDMSKFWWITLALNVGLSIADERILKKAGHNTAGMGSAWLVPVYLYKRAKILNQNNAYFIVWMVLFVLDLYGVL